MPNDALKIRPLFSGQTKLFRGWDSGQVCFADFLNQEVWEKNFKHYALLTFIKIDTRLHFGTLYMMMDTK